MEEEKKLSSLKYFEAVGRRKTASAQVKLFLSDNQEIIINGKQLKDYFPSFFLQHVVLAPFNLLSLNQKFRVEVKVKGGGKQSQAEAIRHGISRALIIYDPQLKQILKKAGFLKRDPRMKERKKYGLKRARRAPQWQKR